MPRAQPHPQPWPFEWPPPPGSAVELWLPQLPDAALLAIRDRLTEAPARFEPNTDSLRITARGGSATIAQPRPLRGGTVVSVEVKCPRWLGGPLSYDALRYPIVFLLGTAFVISLGFASEVPIGVYRGCVALMFVATLVISIMWFIGYDRQARRNAARTDFGQLRSLGCALADLGARPVPPADNPFRR